MRAPLVARSLSMTLRLFGVLMQQIRCKPTVFRVFYHSCEISLEAKAISLTASFWEIFSTACRFKLPQDQAQFSTSYRLKVQSFLELLRGKPLDRSGTLADSLQKVACDVFTHRC